MTHNFIELTDEFGNATFVNPFSIVSVSGFGYGKTPLTRITFTGHSVSVKESAKEIFEKIEQNKTTKQIL